MTHRIIARVCGAAGLCCAAIATLAAAQSPAAGEAQPAASSPREAGTMALDSPADIRLHFSGPMGDRIDANLRQWLLVAPDANPGLIEMFRLRDRKPEPNLVPWAGEFVGKYLQSAIESLPLVDEPALERQTAELIRELIATQSEDGYLGPFTRDQRLMGNWDLWGHYHVMLGLMMWFERTGDRAAIEAATRAGDLACKLYLDSGRRVLDAGSPEMNMAIIHSLGRLYRHTGQSRYLELARQILKEWESAGDYFRRALSGTPFFQTASPRWESLHDLQGLVELYRITGDESFRRAYAQLWHSILEQDIHPSGAFSSGEQAVGHPFGTGAIETCCTVAWMAMSLDMLRLTGDPLVADELERSTWNAMLGAQHPSGRWWTYNTPLSGVRESSAHTIVFQSRYGTPELNCCSVNGPRTLGMLSEWAVMTDAEGPRVNYYGPSSMTLRLADGSALGLEQTTNYPRDGVIELKVKPESARRFNLRLRIPSWSRATRVTLNGGAEGIGPIEAGSYCAIDREWQPGDTVRLELDMAPRYLAGGYERQGAAAIFAGPLLMAADQHWNTVDPVALPKLDVSALALEPAGDGTPARFQPIKLANVRAADGQALTLCDFASAGAHGTAYAAWLPAANAKPAILWRVQPRRDQAIAAGPVLFEWADTRTVGEPTSYTLQVAEDQAFERLAFTRENLGEALCLANAPLTAGKAYFWRVLAVNSQGQTESTGAPWSFTIDAALPNTAQETYQRYQSAQQGIGERRLILDAPLAGSGEPRLGALQAETGAAPAADRAGKDGRAVAFAGEPQARITYTVPAFPQRDYSVACWLSFAGATDHAVQEVFSAWCANQDDPLRLAVQDGMLHARIEAGIGYGTAGVRIEPGRWLHAAAVKQGPTLSLYIDGKLAQQCNAPAVVRSQTRLIGIGNNPSPIISEPLTGRVSDVLLAARAWTAEEVAAIRDETAAPQE